jgi:hypothetical protein
MNRSILIVICDFLLLSLLTFSTDINRMADEDTSHSTAKVDIVTNNVVEPGQDLAAVMKLALEEEHKGHAQLQQQLAQAQAAANQQQAQLSQHEQAEQKLQQQIATTQAGIEKLNQQLQTTAAQAQAAQQKLALTETEKQEQVTLTEALRRQLDELNRKNQLALNAQQQLANQLQLSEVEKNAATERAALMQQQVQVERAEKAQLAEGFKALATNSSALTQEIRENRALAPNTIFSDFVTNRVQAGILAAKTGFLHIDNSKRTQTKTILVTDGTNTFAICHVDDTPLAFWDPGTDWDGLTGTLAGNAARVAIRAMSFQQQDPRVVMMPVSAAEAQQLGSKVYRLSADPYKFQDAVLVGANEGYYGECNFEMDVNTPQYLKLDRSLLRGLFGKFNPSRGDLVFSRTGDLLGVMVNGTFCLVLQNFTPAATLAFAPDVRKQHTGATLARLYDYVFQLPLRLQ